MSKVTILHAAGSWAFSEVAKADLKAGAADKNNFRIRVVRAGTNDNGVRISGDILKANTLKFDKAPVYTNHEYFGCRDVRDTIGGIYDPVFVKGAAGEQGYIEATLKLLEPNGDVAQKFRNALANNMTSLFGFSYSIIATGENITQAGSTVLDLTAIERVQSVDWVDRPAADGRLLDLAASKQNAQPYKKEKSMDKINADTNAAKDASNAITAEALQAVQEQANQAETQLKLLQAQVAAKELIAQSELPKAAKDKLVAQFSAAKEPVKPDAVAEVINAEAEYLKNITASNDSGGVVTGLGAKVTKDASDNLSDQIAAFFDPQHKAHDDSQSLKQLFEAGGMGNSRRGILLEAAQSSDFVNLLNDGLNKRLVAMYNNQNSLQLWRQISRIVPLSDYKDQKRVRWGGFGNIPVVAEDAAYTQQTIPSDEKVTYAPKKHGGLYYLTEEAIRNDDVSALRDLPVKVGRAAARTLNNFVFSLISSNGNIYDGETLFHASHNNLGTAALSSASFAAARLAMMKQAEAGSSEQLGIGPNYILVPPELRETAYNLFVRGTNNDKDFVQSQSITPIEIPALRDANNWYLVASPQDITGLEVGFMDGRQQPDLLVQNNPQSGQMFTHDRITWKVRHIYGGAIIDYRAFYGAVVA